MLGKLLKYELKASARTLLPLYAGILILSLVCGLFLATQADAFMNSDRMNLFFGILYLLLFALWWLWAFDRRQHHPALLQKPFR